MGRQKAPNEMIFNNNMDIQMWDVQGQSSTLGLDGWGLEQKCKLLFGLFHFLTEQPHCLKTLCSFSIVFILSICWTGQKLPFSYNGALIERIPP